MPRVSYTAPSTVDEAVKALAGATGQTRVLSGGTDLLVQLKSGRARPELIVDAKGIPGLIGIREEADAFVIGAATPGVMISADERLVKAFPGVVEGVDLIGSTQIQGRASIAGNLCNASPAADSVPPVIAARATAVIAGPSGRRQVPVEQIVTGPGQTSLAKGEFVVEFRVPKPKSRQSDAYLRFIPRTEMDIAVVGVGISLTMKGDTVTDARVGLGAVAPTVLLVDKAAKALIGSKLDDAALDAAAAACSAACKPIDDKRGTIKYRTKIAGVLLKRTAMIARDRINGIEHRGHRPV